MDKSAHIATLIDRREELLNRLIFSLQDYFGGDKTIRSRHDGYNYLLRELEVLEESIQLLDVSPIVGYISPTGYCNR